MWRTYMVEGKMIKLGEKYVKKKEGKIMKENDRSEEEHVENL